MSGIAGVVRLDGAPADAGPLAAAMAHRAPIAVLHAPGEDMLAVDARIDNGLSVRDAWQRWGEDCAPHLEGDFAFAVWDARTRTLFCARDPFGVKPFVYAFLPGKLFAFASEPRALLALDAVPRDVDEQRVADFLELRFEDAERTFHRALRRLPGGCTLTLRDGKVEIRRYWTPRNVKPLRLRGGDAAYAEGYREHFVRAVRERMQVDDPATLGAMLSGGLDSSAIACVARDELRDAGRPPLPVISWIFSDAMEADEREYQQAVIAAGGMRPLTLDSAHNTASPWTDLELLLPDGPPYAPNFYLNTEAAKLARAHGIRVLLDGLGGDVTVSRGESRFVELFTRGRFPTLARELRALAARRGTSESLPRLFAAKVALPLAPHTLLRLLSRIRRRQYTRGRRFLSVRQEHLFQLEAPFLAEGLELFDRLLSPFGIEGRYPFFDRRLTEYCLSLPADQKLADGYSRIVARRAMEGVLPDFVRWRAGKGAPGMHILSALRASLPELDELFGRDAAVIERWADVDALRNSRETLRSGGRMDFREVIRLWSAAVLARWLRRQ
ncbi:MAG TPA: asparagine synthase-related protein [Thermoanaerobaculia bacterium]